MTLDVVRPPPARRDAALAAIVVAVSVIPPLERLRVPGWISDDTALAVAIRTWRPWEGDLLVVENSYLLHVPLLVLDDLLLRPSPLSLFAVALVLHSVGLWLVVAFARHAVAEVMGVPVDRLGWRHDLTAVAIIAAYQVGLSTSRVANAGVTTRNLETGLYLLVLRLGWEVARGRRRIDGRRAVGAVAAATMVLSLNDPLVAYTMLGPFVLLGGAAFLVGRTVGPVTRLSVATALGLVAWRVVLFVAPVVGIEVQSSTNATVAIGDLSRHTRVVVGGLLDLAGRELFVDDALGIRLLGAVLGALALAAVGVVVAMFAQLRTGRPWLAMLALGWLTVVTLSYLLTTSGESRDEFRYVVAAFPAVPIAVAVAVATLRPRIETALAVVAALAFAITAPLALVRDHTDAEALMPDAAAVVDRLADDGYDRGYSGFWSASIVTYLSDGRAPVLATLCSENGRSVPHEFVADMGQFQRAVEHPGDRSFVIVDRRESLRLACPTELLIAQHGEPIEVIVVDDSLEIWLYHHDVVAELTAADAGAG